MALTWSALRDYWPAPNSLEDDQLRSLRQDRRRRPHVGNHRQGRGPAEGREVIRLHRIARKGGSSRGRLFFAAGCAFQVYSGACGPASPPGCLRLRRQLGDGRARVVPPERHRAGRFGEIWPQRHPPRCATTGPPPMPPRLQQGSIHLRGCLTAWRECVWSMHIRGDVPCAPTLSSMIS